MNFTEALKTLESQNCRLQDKADAYQAVLSDFQNEATRQEDESFRSESQRLLKLLSQDILLNSENVVKIGLDILHHCLQTSYFRSSQSTDSAQLLQALVRCAHKTPSVDILKRSLDCLAAQDFSSSVLIPEISSIVDMVEAGNAKAKAQSLSVLEETVNLFFKLDNQVSEGLRPHCKRWARFLLPGLVAISDVTREKSYSVLIKYKAELCQASDLSKHLTKAITSGLAQSLKCLMAKNEIYALKTWALVIEICGKEFHKGSSINSMLEIVEIGFKSTPQAKCEAFIAWRSLISNFGLDKSVISDPKRIKLLMMVFKYDNAKTESVAVEKMLTWWHFITEMDQKLIGNFEKIIYPMLQFCAGSSKVQLTQRPRAALKPSATNLPSGVLSPQISSSPEVSAFPAVQKLGLEALALLLSKSSHKNKEITWTLKPLSIEILGGASTFAKHAIILLNATHQIFKSLKKEINESLVLYIWTALAGHIKTALENSTKSELRDVLSTFLNDLHSIVEEGIFTGETLFNMVEACNMFPVKVLASTAFNVRGTVRGCPALILSEVLLSPVVMEASSSSERYQKLFSFLVNAGASNIQGALGYLQTVSGLLDSNASALSSSEELWKLWNSIAHILQSTIISSNEVNQGDALEYNFGCLHSVLLLPLKHQLATKVSQANFKAIIKIWRELYHSFARLSALVPTAEANACLEETCSKIIKSEVEFKEPLNLECLTTIAYKMLDCIDFSAFATTQGPGAMLTLSPRKWVKRRQRPLGNLDSFVHLLQTLQESINSLIFNEKEGGNEKNPSSVIFTVHTLVDLYIRFFAHINTTAVIINSLTVLAEPLSSLYKTNTPCNLQRLFVPSFLVKLEKLWHEISLCIGGRFSDPYNSELLAAMSPLFEVTFLHSRRAIKNQAVALWNTTFSKAQTLEYPTALKPVLSRVKEKVSIVLPNWISQEDIPIIAESPYSEMSMGMDSQIVAPPVLPSMPSPNRPRASILNRETSPVASKNASPPPSSRSPAKILTPKQARKLFSPTVSHSNIVDLMPEEEFVVINSPSTKKKRLLTEHQKEVLKEKSVLPAMYNNLDASQDVSLMSQFGTETQNENSMTSDVIVINSSNSQDQDKKSASSAMLPPKSNVKPHSVRSSRRLFERSQSKEIEKNEMEDSNNSNIIFEAKTSESVSTHELEKSEKNDSISSTHIEKPAADIQEESPFKMFRQTTGDSSLFSVGKDSQTKASCQDGPGDNGISGSGKKTKKVQDKEPRRVTLKTLDSLAAKKEDTNVLAAKKDLLLNVTEGTDSSVGNNDAEETTETGKNPRTSTEKHSSPETLRAGENKTELNGQTSSVSGVLSSWTAQLAKSMSKVDTVLQDQPEITPETDNSVTLVEDTQSPDNLKKQASKQTESITETPTKSDESSSPHLRSSSARKLFADDPKHKLSETTTPYSPATEQQLQAEVVVELNKVNSDEAISSSQGFEPAEETTKEKSKALDIHTMFGFSQLTEEDSEDPLHSGKTDKTEGPVENDTEAERVFPTGEESGNFVLSMMPTMASSNHAESLVSSSKSSDISNKTQSSSSEASSVKSSCQETDFFPQQPTFQESSLKEVVNKRKRALPKKLSPDMQKRVRRSKNQKEQRDTKVENAVSKPNTDCKDKSDDILEKFPAELGEITPDMKSPTTTTPVRGHSSIKRKRKLSKETAENPKARKSISPEVDKEAKELLNKLEQNAFQLAKAALRRERVKVGSSHLRKSSRTKHMLRTRRRSSPPNKLRRLNDENQVETADMNRSLPILCEEGTSKNCNSESDSDDDMPLVKLRKVSAEETSKSTNANVDLTQQNKKLNSVAPQRVESFVPPPITECNTPTKNSLDKACMGNKSSVESSPCLSERSCNFDVVDEVLSSVLSEMVKEMSAQKGDSPQQTPATNEEFTPLLLSEDVHESMNNQPDESQDHLQAGQSNGKLQDGNEPVIYWPRDEDMETDNQHDSSETRPLNLPLEGNLARCNIDSGIKHNSGVDSHDTEVSGNELPVTGDDRQVLNAQEETGKVSPGDTDKMPSLTKESDAISSTNKISSLKEKRGDDDKIPSLAIECDSANDRYESSVVREKSTEAKSVLHDWSPSKSPSFSILKKGAGQTPSPNRNRVSFAEPVVNGESPVREKYHIESLPTSPLISKSSQQRKGTPFARSMGRVSGYKRRLGQSMRQVRLLQGPENLSASPTKSPSHYKATQESQLDSKNPIFADLVDCTKPVDDILHQLTSSLWYRGLHHMMKGRNINTIGDLASLTEVQVSQLPIRHPKVDTVRASLKNYMAQHGLFKPVIKLSSHCAVTSTPISKGATIGQAVTPSSIADEGIEIRGNDDDLDRLSPIEGVDPEECITTDHSSKGNINTESQENIASTESLSSPEPGIISILTGLSEEVRGGEILPALDTFQLYEVHQKLNDLFAAVVGEMKARHSQSS